MTLKAQISKLEDAERAMHEPAPASLPEHLRERVGGRFWLVVRPEDPVTLSAADYDALQAAGVLVIQIEREQAGVK